MTRELDVSLPRLLSPNSDVVQRTTRDVSPYLGTPDFAIGTDGRYTTFT